MHRHDRFSRSSSLRPVGSLPRPPSSGGVSSPEAFPPLPPALPHPVLCGRRAQWLFTLFLTAGAALGTVLGLARASQAAEPCALPRVQPEVIEGAMASLARAPKRPQDGRWSRLGALLPRRVSWGLRDFRTEGAGWYQAVDGDLSERGLWGQTAGWSLKLVWDLQPLWSAPSRAVSRRLDDPLARAERLQQVASRLAGSLRSLTRLRVQAEGLGGDGPECARLRARAEGLLMIVRATLRAAR